MDIDEIPDAFKVSQPEQESLLLSYEASKTNSNTRLNPTKGFKQTYKVELGTESLLSDANMAIVSAGWRFIYSLGENDNHQFVGRGDASYIFTDDFNNVPYNLRFFTGGDQSLRGFDYKSLSPEENGYKLGGQALGVGSLEYNYQFKDGWRAAVFSDFGNAYDKQFSNPTEYSVGVGIRWRSPIGPIRLDIASGISNENNPIRLHFFIGPQL
ncbi:autotransporter assembly complex family protein [Acinetobacter vivianii]